MSMAPFDTDLVMARLQSEVPTLRQVSGAADFAAVKSLRDFAPPCAFVLLGREKGVPNPGVTTGQQHAIVTFGVVVAVRNYRASERGQQAASTLNDFLAQTRKALIGWVPALPGARPIQFVQGDLVDYDQATVLWTDLFKTQHSLQ